MITQEDKEATDEYQEGKNAWSPGAKMNDSDDCPYPIGSGDPRTFWMSGFFDAYFQDVCNRNNLGRWGK